MADHPTYAHDSVVSEAIAKDLISAVLAIGERERAGKGWKDLGDVPGLERLLGKFRSGCGSDKNENGDGDKTS